MGGAFAYAVGERFEALTDCDDESGGNRWAINPGSVEVLGLETGMRRDLEEV